MSTNTDVTRRSFMQMVGSSGLLSLAGAVPAFGAVASEPAQQPRFAYVASSKKGSQGIHVFAITGARWTSTHFVASQAPSALALSPDKRTLFAANRVRRYRNLPTASVESYRIEAGSGRLTLINRQPLALSAIHPEHLAVSPDGKYLAVSATGGGSYNVLPIAEDGSLQPVAALRKELGMGTHPVYQASSRPQQIAFDGAGRLLTTDLGTDRVSVFELADGDLLLKQRTQTAPESGPGMVAITGGHSHLFVGNALDGTIATYTYDEATGDLSLQQNSVRTVTSAGLQLASLSMHPRRRVLYSAARGNGAGSLTAWEFNPESGSLQHVARVHLLGEPASLSISPDGSNLFALDAANNAVMSVKHHAAVTEITAALVASVPVPTALALVYS
jgi:6-phosphogluconolactonase